MPYNLNDVPGLPPRLPAFVLNNPLRPVRLKPQAQMLLAKLKERGKEGVSQRDAMIDLGMTSATLASRVSELAKAGLMVAGMRRVNPYTKRGTTTYVLLFNAAN